MAEATPPCRLYLQIPALASQPVTNNFVQAIESFDVACALLTAEDATPFDMEWATHLRALCHSRDIAFLLHDSELVKSVGADGVHLPIDPASYSRARALLGQEAIIGVDCAANRHDAMVLAEMGVDYVAFPARMQSMTRSDDLFDDLIRWWSEIFQIPCVAWNVALKEEAVAAVQSGADFIALKSSCLVDPGAAAHLAELVTAMRGPR